MKRCNMILQMTVYQLFAFWHFYRIPIHDPNKLIAIENPKPLTVSL
jgi:hypothetical protein